MCGTRQQVWDVIRSYTKLGPVYNPVKPLMECPVCELPDLRHILQQLWYYTKASVGENSASRDAVTVAVAQDVGGASKERKSGGAWGLCGCMLIRFSSELHGESCKRLAPPRNTKYRIHLQSTQSTVNRHNSQTKHQALRKCSPGDA